MASYLAPVRMTQVRRAGILVRDDSKPDAFPSRAEPSVPADRSKRDVIGVVRGLSNIGPTAVLGAFADYLDGVGHDVAVDLALPVTTAQPTAHRQHGAGLPGRRLLGESSKHLDGHELTVLPLRFADEGQDRLSSL